MLRGWDLSFWQGEVPYNFRRLNTWSAQVNAVPCHQQQHDVAPWTEHPDHVHDHLDPDQLTVQSGNMEIDS